jgi:hypothetical protein
MEKLLTARELARELKCRTEQIYRVLSKQGIPFVPVGKRKRYFLSQVVAFLQMQKQCSSRARRRVV